MEQIGGESALATLFRRQSGRLVARLAGVVGIARVDLAEDAVQDALVAALQAWKLGLPRDPEAWLLAVARNRLRDVWRRERVRGSGDIVGDEFDDLTADESHDERLDLLRLMFACCLPGVSEDGQVALMLRLVCGFGVKEVAHAFLVAPDAMERRGGRDRRVARARGARASRVISVLLGGARGSRPARRRARPRPRLARTWQRHGAQ